MYQEEMRPETRVSARDKNGVEPERQKGTQSKEGCVGHCRRLQGAPGPGVG